MHQNGLGRGEKWTSGTPCQLQRPARHQHGAVAQALVQAVDGQLLGHRLGVVPQDDSERKTWKQFMMSWFQALKSGAFYSGFNERGPGRKPGATLYTRKRLSHGGQGVILVPPYTRGRVSLSRFNLHRLASDMSNLAAPAGAPAVVARPERWAQAWPVTVTSPLRRPVMPPPLPRVYTSCCLSCHSTGNYTRPLLSST